MDPKGFWAISNWSNSSYHRLSLPTAWIRRAKPKRIIKSGIKVLEIGF
jgi:hypothetical protein